MPARVPFLVVAALLGGCAFHDARIGLTYPPRGAGSPRDSGTARPLPAAFPSPEVLVLEPLVDRRLEELVGEGRSSWGIHTTTVESEDPLLPWVREALIAELARVGLQVAGAEPSGLPDAIIAPPRSGWRLWVALDVAFASERFFTDGEVTLTAALARDQKKLFHRHYTGLSSVAPREMPPDQRWSEALARALRQAAREVALEARRAIDGG